MCYVKSIKNSSNQDSLITPNTLASETYCTNELGWEGDLVVER